MILLAAADFIVGQAGASNEVASTIFGMELNAGVETYKVLDQRFLLAATATLYTAPASTTAFIRSITLVNNNSTVARTVTLYRGGTATSNIIAQFSIPISGMAVYEDGQGWQIFNSLGQLLQSTAATNAISAALTADTANQTSTTEAVVSQVLTVPANYLQSGTTIDFQLAFSGAQGAVAQSTPGIVYQLRWGGVAGALIASVGIITPATLLAASAGMVRGLMTVRTIGASGTCKGALTVYDPRGTRIAAGDIPVKVGKTGTAVNIDTTSQKDLVLTCKTTIADAACITFGESGLTVVERLS